MRMLSTENLRWVLRHRAWTPYYLKRYWRFALFRLRHPEVVTEGLVFLGKDVEICVRKGYGRLVLGKWVHLGDNTRLRAHEGTLRIGDKVVFAREVTVNCYLDIEIGASTLVADWAYICDFDHRTEDITVPIKDQGLAKSPVRIGPDCWLATKVTVLRGTDIGRGTVIAANSVARGTIPSYSIAAGLPARVVKDRAAAYVRRLDPQLGRDATAGAVVPSDMRPPRGGHGPGSHGERSPSYSAVRHYVPDVIGEETRHG